MSPRVPDEVERWATRWGLVLVGPVESRPASCVARARWKDRDRVLKVARHEEEERGGRLMTWWDGCGAASVLLHEGPALLMERAAGDRSLVEMANTEAGDAEAARIVCGVGRQLHQSVSPVPAWLTPLDRWFDSLHRLAAEQSRDSLFAQSAAISRELLATQRDVVALHGDLHHENVLHTGEAGREWVAIDPKALHGERAFDFANLFLNPTASIALRAGRLQRLAALLANEAGIERGRLLQWVAAYAGLSAAWDLEDGNPASLAIGVAELALQALDETSRRGCGVSPVLGARDEDEAVRG